MMDFILPRQVQRAGNAFTSLLTGQRLKSMHCTWILLVFIVEIAVVLSVDKPCWCHSLQDKIKQTRELLINQYGLKHLEKSTVFATSGINNALEKRLVRSLNEKKPFKLGVLGGSYSVPQGTRFNPWSGNVTRWLNTILSTSECNIQFEIPLNPNEELSLLLLLLKKFSN